MQNQKSFKKEFLKKWITGLQICSSSKVTMSLLERKKAIKLSADLAMASTGKYANRHWSRALISKASKDSETGTLAKQISQSYKILRSTNNIKGQCNLSSKATYTKPICYTSSRNYKYKFRKHVPRKSSGASNSYNKVTKARSMAKRLVNKRTQILKGLVPGGEYLDEHSLVKETIDYIMSLRAQVEIMHHLANSPQLSISN